MIAFKMCSKCKEFKPFNEFRKSAASKDGIRPDCKVCGNKISKEYKKKPEAKERQKEWWEKNKEVQKIKKRKYDNSDHGKEMRKKRKENMKNIRINGE